MLVKHFVDGKYVTEFMTPEEEKAMLDEHHKRCINCYYFRKLGYTSDKCCHYSIDNDHTRPCPAGKDCTEFITKTSKNAKNKGEELKRKQNPMYNVYLGGNYDIH